MNKRHYEHTLPNIRGSLSNTYYYMGYIRNTQCIKAHFSDGWLGFGFSDIRGTCKYILKSMRKVIRGDYSSIRGAGHSVDMP